MKTLLDVQELIGCVNAGTFSCGTKLHRFIAAGIPAAEAFEAVKAEQRALIDRVSQLDASIEAFREAAAKPDPEKWDDIDASAYRVSAIFISKSKYYCDFKMDGKPYQRAEGNSLAESLNSIRRKIGIPER